MKKQIRNKVDRTAAEAAFGLFLEHLGVDMNDPNVTDTPQRVTKMFCDELLAGHTMEDTLKITSFDTPEVGEQFIVVKDIDVHSMCSHHMMPIRGIAHIGAYFIPDITGKTMLPGLSKYARVVEMFARRLQIQERMTAQIADFLIENLPGCAWVYVLVDSEHYCMKHRGVKIGQSSTVTEAMRHVFGVSKAPVYAVNRTTFPDAFPTEMVQFADEIERTAAQVDIERRLESLEAKFYQRINVRKR